MCPSVVVVAAVLESASCRGSRNPDNLDLFEVWHICRLPRMLQLQILDLVLRLKTTFQAGKKHLIRVKRSTCVRLRGGEAGHVLQCGRRPSPSRDRAGPGPL